MKRIMVFLLGSALLCGAVWASVTLVDLTVDPPEVLYCNGEEGVAQRIDQGISITNPGNEDTRFEFLWNEGINEVADEALSWQAYYLGVPLDGGEGTDVPLSELGPVDEIRFFAPGQAFSWDELRIIKCHRIASIANSDDLSKTSPEVLIPGQAKSLSADTAAQRVTDVGQMTYKITIEKPDPIDFRLFGVAAPGGTITREGLPVCSGNSTYYSNVVSVVATGGVFIPPCDGLCRISSESDDNGYITVGDITANSTLHSSGVNQMFVVGGQSYPVKAGFDSVGGPYFFTPKIEFIPGARPHLEISPNTIRFSVKIPQNEVNTRFHDVTIVGDNIDLNRYTIACADTPEGVKIIDNRFVIDMEQTDYWEGQTGTNTIEVTYHLLDEGVQIDSAAAVFEVDTEREKKCCDACPCTEGSDVSNNSVDFSQKFGRTPWIHGMPSGALRIHETSPSARLGTPAVLYYDHPLGRHILTQRGLDVVVADASGECTEYKNGCPYGVSAGGEGHIYRENGCLVEVLSDRTKLVYNPNGFVESIVPPDGMPVQVSELGISIETDEDGYLSRVYSRSDGEMLITRASESSWTLTWRSPSGVFVKSFTFTLDNSHAFTLYEYRNEEFNFHYRWTYVDSAKDWVLEKGLSSVTREEKSVEWNSSNCVWEVVRRFVDSNNGSVVEARSILDTERGIGKTLSRQANGQNLYLAERDKETGLITNECHIGSAPQSYRYDNYGRVKEEMTTARGGLTKSTSYEYAEPSDICELDRRPTHRIERLGGAVIAETSYVYSTNSVETIRTFGETTRGSRIEFDALGRRTLSVSENGRASRIVYSDVDEDCSWSETTDEGVWSEQNGFELIDGKSTRSCNEFDASGNCLRSTRSVFVDGDWHETGWTTNRYNATHKIVYTEHSDGRSSAAEWICTGSVWERDESGVVVSNRYDGAKRKIATTRHSPLGAITTSYIYDAAGRIVRELTTADGCETNAVERTYDERGRVIWEMDNGQVTTTSYSDDDLITTITYADGGTRVTTRNADGSLASITGTAVTSEYHTYGVTEEGLEWECVRYGRIDSPRFEKTYRNGFGETVRVERSGFGGSTLVTENTYNEKGQLVQTIETGKPTITYVYDDWGDRISITQSAGGVSRTTESESAYVLLDGEVWRGSAQAISTSDSTIAPLVTESYSKVSGLSLDRIAESFTVDVRGNTNRTWSVVIPSEAKRMSWSTRAGVGNIAFSESIDGAMTHSVNTSAITNTVHYDAFKRQVATTDGRGNTTSYVYDKLGRMSRQIDPCGNETAYVYDAMGRISEVTNELGNVTFTRYDLRGNKTYEGGATYPVSYTYDEFGNRTSMTTYRNEASTEGDTTIWVYDEATGLVTQKLYADGHGPCYTYTNDGKLATRTWARGIVTNYGYDAWGNLTSTTYSDGTPSVMLSYDALGRLKTANDVAGTTTYTYDAFGSEAQIATFGLYSKTLVRHRDAYGRDLGHSMDSSRKNVIEYDAATGRIRREQLGGAWYMWTYLPGTDLKSSLSVGTAATTAWGYEPHRDLLTQVKNTVYGSVASQYDYTNDSLGRRTAIARSGAMMSEQRSDAYGYNTRSELISAAKNGVDEYAYQYDDIGNRESSVEPDNAFSYTANELNQYTEISAVNLDLEPQPFVPQYDLDGNQTLVKTKTGIWSVTYNGENRPILWTCGATNIVMKFDRMGRRVEYIEREGETTLKHQKFVYDGYLCIQRLNGANNVVTDLFEWDPTEPVATRPLFWQPRTAEGNFSLFYTYDGNKNVSEVVFYQRARGVAAHYEYAPFGAVTVQTRGNAWGSIDLSMLNPWRFSSEYADDTMGLVYYNYRHYEPVMGRWFRRDPCGQNYSLVYVFCLNGAQSRYDWRGLIDDPIDSFFNDSPPERSISHFVEVEYSVLDTHEKYIRYRVDFIARFSRPSPWEKSVPTNTNDSDRNAIGGHSRQYIPSPKGDLDPSYWGLPELVSEDKSWAGVVISRRYRYPNKKFRFGYVLYCIKDSESEWRQVMSNLDMYSEWEKGVRASLRQEDMALIYEVVKCETCIIQWGDKGWHNQKSQKLKGPR